MGFLTDTDTNHVFYSYVYDCGSEQLDALRREMKLAKSLLMEDDLFINTVFISHLDADHINGFEQLCELVDGNIHNIILPYIDIEEKYYIVARALSEINISSSYLEFVINSSE